MRERPVCRCDDCAKEISQAEGDLQEAINSHTFEIVDVALGTILKNETDIDVQMLDEA